MKDTNNKNDLGLAHSVMCANGYHLVLVNKKTGRVASSNSWQIALASVACQGPNHSGILGLLPIAKASRLLKNNVLQQRKKRGENGKIVRLLAREQARSLLPKLRSNYLDTSPKHRPFRCGDFCNWIVDQLRDDRSLESKLANQKGFDELIAADYSQRWWLDQLHNLQS